MSFQEIPARLFSAFESNMPWLEERTIFLTKHGSQAYGTNTPTSDLDLKGFAIPTREYFLGFDKVFEQGQTNTPLDLVVYDIRKFMSLAADCNPSIIEVLWTAESDWLICKPHGRQIVENRELFISKKARWTFSGYAISQLKRIKLHKKYLTNPPVAPPNRADFGLPDRSIIPKDQLAAAESLIKKKIDSWSPDLTGMDDAARIHIMTHFNDTLVEIASAAGVPAVDDLQFKSAANGMGYDNNFLELLDRERKYKNALNEWTGYQSWKEKRNPARAELEAKFLYDTKHGMHLVRLMRMCREILETGKVVVKRPDAEELLQIRNGLWPYDRLVEWAETQDKEFEQLYKTSKLPREPNRKALNQLCCEIVASNI